MIDDKTNSNNSINNFKQFGNPENVTVWYAKDYQMNWTTLFMCKT